MIHFITYSNDLYSAARNYCIKMALKRGKVDTVTAYKPENIDRKFWKSNQAVLEQKVGNGLWLWKPYFINKKLGEVNVGDIVLYCDAASYFFKNCKNIIASMKDDIWVTNIPLIEKQFTKPELFEMMGCDDESFGNTNQIQANFIAIRKSERGAKFVEEWLCWCCKDDALTKNTTFLDNPPEYKFLGHRSDQSVLSLLVKKWDLEVHQDPSQYGRIPEKYFTEGRIYQNPKNFGEYKPSIILHRRKRPSFKTCISQWMCTWLPLSIIHTVSKPCREVVKIQEGSR